MLTWSPVAYSPNVYQKIKSLLIRAKCSSGPMKESAGSHYNRVEGTENICAKVIGLLFLNVGKDHGLVFSIINSASDLT